MDISPATLTKFSLLSHNTQTRSQHLFLISSKRKIPKQSISATYKPFSGIYAQPTYRPRKNLYPQAAAATTHNHTQTLLRSHSYPQTTFKSLSGLHKLNHPSS